MRYEIYKYTCKENGRYYIGCHYTINGTEKDKYYGCSHNDEYWNDREKYGENKFTLDILASTEDLGEARKLEAIHIVTNKIDRRSYNLYNGGALAPLHSIAQCEKISNALIGNTNAVGNKSLSGRTHTAEACKAISTGMIGNVNALGSVPSKATLKLRGSSISESWERRELIKCPYCSCESKSAANMKRWHFDNCKTKLGVKCDG